MEARSATPDPAAAARNWRTTLRPRWAVALRPARLVAIALLLLSGGLLVTIGAVLDKTSGYLAAVLLEIGAALFLAVPLILLEQLLSLKIKESEANVQDQLEVVAEDVHRAQTRIDLLGDETLHEIAAARASDAEMVERLRADSSESNVWRALHRVQELLAVDDAGVRVRVPGASLRMRFKARPGDATAAGPVDISVEDRDGKKITGFESWSPDESAVDALVSLAQDLWRQGAYPNDERFDATEIFQSLADVLGTVLHVWTSGRPGGQLGRVIELHGPWVVTQYGLEHIDDAHRRVRTRKLLDDRDGARAALLTSDDQDAEVNEAIKTAVAYHKGVAQRTADLRAPAKR